MRVSWCGSRLPAVLVAACCAPAFSAVSIVSLSPSVASPEALGTSISWTATASNTGKGKLTFRFNIAPPGGHLSMVADFNVGTLSSGTWTAPPFVWVPTAMEGVYRVQVVAKDFTSGAQASQTVSFTVSPLVKSNAPLAVATANPLVALFSAPACAVGSQMRISFAPLSGGVPANSTNWVNCNASASMTFEVAGMYPSTAYSMFAQTNTNGNIVNGPAVSFTTGPLPTSIPFPEFNIGVGVGASTDTADSTVLINTTQLSGTRLYPNVAIDLSGKVMWYYSASLNHGSTITRPLPNATMLTIQYGKAWATTKNQQLLIQIDLAGNTIRETNTGAVQQQLLSLGAVDGGPCDVFPSPPPVGSGCLDTFSHDAIQFNIGPNQYTALLSDIERIFPAGTQGDTSGLPVDIRGSMIVVLDSNWQAVWYWDSFNPAGGGNGYPLLPITRVAPLDEICSIGQPGCDAIQLLGPGISPTAIDWLHCNSLYYWPTDTSGGASGDLVWSSRNQDWVMKVDYHNGTGKGDLLWTMGPCGSFAFNNVYNDPWPWFSGQHDAGMENNGAGPLTVFDDGNTRVSRPGRSTQCMPGAGGGNSRGMALSVDEAGMQVTPVLSADLGGFSPANGSAQLLSNGNYFFLSGVVAKSGYAIEIFPTPGTETGTQALNIQGSEGYRAWRMPSLYAPPTT
ncbi:MAG TPA: aryl-sulfate sulfotransferase [Bryobacteraceae bacterium]|nr:aryl-sulfate sulfotransferase [Bryobacteraceae bacterium]